MFRSEPEMEKEIREKMRGGEGNTEILHIFKSEELQGKARLFAKLRLEKGASIGFHRHIDEEEIYYILRGQGRVDDNGESREVGPGDGVLTGGGNGHSIANIGDEPLELLAVILLYE